MRNNDWHAPRFWLDRLVLFVYFLLLRAVDLLLLLPRPILLITYLRIWLQEILHSPFTRAYPFEAVLAIQQQGQNATELSYGETPVSTGIWLLARAGVGRNSRVLDLGAGRGRALLAARWLLAEARGVEIIADHVERTAGSLKLAGVELVTGSMFEADLAWPTHIYIAWTAFEHETCLRLAARLRDCPSGTRVISIDRKLWLEEYDEVATRVGLFCWGVAPVWVWERR